VDIQKYIASGILEAYVLGDLTLAEQQEVRAMLDSYPELKVELEKIEKDFEAIAIGTGIEPTISFDKIFNSVSSDVPVVPASDNVLSNIETKKADKDSRSQILSFQRQITKFQRIAIAASIAALVASGVAINYYGKYQESDNALAALQSEQQEFAENYNVVKNQLTDIESDLAVINDSNAERIVLGTAESGEPGATANLYWNRATEDVYVSIQNLKELAADQQYQLWAIIDGKPVDAGTFDWDASGLVKMKPFKGDVALFAVTIEKRGGSPTPSLETMQVAGAPSQS